MFAKPALIALALMLAAAVPAAAQPKPLTVRIITSSPGSLNTNFTLIMGEKDAVLIDAPFLKSDAHRLVADILDSGRQLKAIFVTHMHPDHYFGLAVLHEAFPNAQILAQPEAAEEFWRSYPNRYAFWGARIGANAPDHPVPPAAYKEATYVLEGQPIELIGPVQGDAVNSTVFWVPSARAVICGDVVFNGSALGIFGQTKAQRAAWVATLNRIGALGPEIVVAGHTRPGAPATRVALDYTRGYLLAFEKAVIESKTPEQAAATMKQAYPEASDQMLSGALQAAFKEKAGPG
jgi:glyoxylase-like metal-dependent hydrolase (beta-lactamase superfamily II)